MCILTASAIEVKSHQRVMIPVSKEENINLQKIFTFLGEREEERRSFD